MEAIFVKILTENGLLFACLVCAVIVLVKYIQMKDKVNMIQTEERVKDVKEQLDRAEVRATEDRKIYRQSVDAFNKSIEEFKGISGDIKNIQQNVEVMKQDIKELKKD